MSKTAAAPSVPEQVEIAIVGSGFSGLAMAARLKRAAAMTS